MTPTQGQASRTETMIFDLLLFIAVAVFADNMPLTQSDHKALMSLYAGMGCPESACVRFRNNEACRFGKDSWRLSCDGGRVRVLNLYEQALTGATGRKRGLFHGVL